MPEYVTDTTIVRLSEYETLKMMDGETQREAAMALLEQAFTGVQQTSHNVIVQMLLRMSYDNQVAALERYHSAVRSGNSGGRPETISAKQVQELTEKGLTQEQIAEKLKCSVSSIQKKQRQLGITRNNSQKPVITGVITRENLDIDNNKDTNKDVDYATAIDADKNKDKYYHSATAETIDGVAATYFQERKPNDHPYVGEPVEQEKVAIIEECENDLPF